MTDCLQIYFYFAFVHTTTTHLSTFASLALLSVVTCNCGTQRLANPHSQSKFLILQHSLIGMHTEILAPPFVCVVFCIAVQRRRVAIFIGNIFWVSLIDLIDLSNSCIFICPSKSSSNAHGFFRHVQICFHLFQATQFIWAIDQCNGTPRLTSSSTPTNSLQIFVFNFIIVVRFCCHTKQDHMCTCKQEGEKKGSTRSISFTVGSR